MLDWTTGWIAMKFATYIQGPSQVGDPLTFPVVPPADQSFNVFRDIFQHLQDGICIDIHPRLWLYLDLPLVPKVFLVNLNLNPSGHFHLSLCDFFT